MPPVDPYDFSTVLALVADGNPTSRSILVNQLRDFGVRNITQCSRVADARSNLEYRNFDMVLCELHFQGDRSTGQDMLDDLRRNQLLPFSTVFVMVTGEASYANVAEAAESALDGYLLKPHCANQLGERLALARVRKIAMEPIFTAMEAEQYERAAELCLQRFNTKAQFWVYAARVGAELLLRLGRHEEARQLYDAVIAARALPWAKLGVARALLEGGQTASALSTLEQLISEDPGYSDAYDVMGRAQFELGRFDEALATYRMAAELTPHSISRQQNLGMMVYYTGDRQAAEKVLERTSLLGLDSKMFDCQSLVLLAFARLERGDHKGLLRCHQDFARLIEKNPDDSRTHRLSHVVDVLSLIQHHKIARVLDEIRAIAGTVQAPEFDFESASNLVALLSHLAHKSIQLPEVETLIERLALRFGATRAMAELLAASASVHAPYGELVRTAYKRVITLSEDAMKLSLRGDPTAAVKVLINHGENTLNSKFIESAAMVLDRYNAKIEDAPMLDEQIQSLRARSKTSTRMTLGEQRRQAGGLSLRVPLSSARRAAPAPLATTA